MSIDVAKFDVPDGVDVAVGVAVFVGVFVATTLHLPKMSPNRGWQLYADPMNVVIGGTRYWRDSSLTGDVARTVMSRRILTPEISAAEAVQNNSAIPAFNNNQSTISQIAPTKAKASAAIRTPPFTSETDWTNDAPACAPPA